MMEFASTLGEENENLRQSIHLFISATHESTREGMDRLLDKANALVIDGVKDRVERYVASLALPTMVFFAFGILLPVMMFSLVPLLTLGSVSSIGPTATPPRSSPTRSWRCSCWWCSRRPRSCTPVPRYPGTRCRRSAGRS